MVHVAEAAGPSLHVLDDAVDVWIGSNVLDGFVRDWATKELMGRCGDSQQRLGRGRRQPGAGAERAGRTGEARPPVGDGGGRFRTSGAGIRTKAGVIRSNAGRCPILARCGIPGVARSACCWMLGHPETERVDPYEGDVRLAHRPCVR